MAKAFGGKKLEEALPGNLRYEDSFLVAVSGGMDSMALLHRLWKSGFQNLTVCHLNHCLRGEDSQLDAALVEKTAAEMGYPFRGKETDVNALAKESGQSIETAARQARHEFFSEVAAETNVHSILLAHHADDQVETILMNLFRGTGSVGLSGMDVSSEMQVKVRTLTLLRPLLQVSRETIQEYVVNESTGYREDASNRDEFALRNRVRHRLLPELSEIFQRDVRSSVLRLARQQRKQASAIEELMPVAAEESLEVSALLEIPEGLRDKVILDWLRQNQVPDCGSREVSLVAEMALSKSKPAKVNLPADIHARRRAGVVFLEFPEGWE